MQGNSTYITDPSTPGQEPRKFAFDYSYWSHDGFKERDDGYLEPLGPQYADQVRLCSYDDNFDKKKCVFLVAVVQKVNNSIH